MKYWMNAAESECRRHFAVSGGVEEVAWLEKIVIVVRGREKPRGKSRAGSGF